MIEFGYHVTAGTILVIDAIQSPNFVAGSSGWIIRQDGSVEFANATIRGVFEADGANNSYVRVTTTGGTGFGTAVIYLRPPDLPAIASAEITAGSVTVLSNQPGGAGFVPTSYLQMELDSPSWSFSSSAVDLRYPAIVMQTASHDGTVQPSAEITTGGAAANPRTFDIVLDGNVTINGKFARRNCFLQIQVNPMASGAGANLLTPLLTVRDNSGMFNGTDTVTIGEAGTYEIGMLGTFTAQAVAAGYRGVQFSVNGTTSRRAKIPTTAALNNEIIGVNLIKRSSLAAGDTIQFFANHTAGANLVFTGDVWVELIEN